MKTITAHELKFWLDNNEAQVVDVREPSEYKEGHIPGSILIPLWHSEQGKTSTRAKQKNRHTLSLLANAAPWLVRN